MSAGKPNATAFPVVDSIVWATPGDATVGSTAGLTKREWFAGLAMQGLLAIPLEGGGDCDERLMDSPVKAAACAVACADALLAELAKEPTP